jgi:MoaA/NifB/PqqE/SkfB family radical SAM enzyme
MKILKERVDFVNIGLDGPRNVTTRIRGDYDKIMRGIHRFKEYGISLSLSCVVLSSTKDAVLFTCQIADLVEAKKLKLILPIPKGPCRQSNKKPNRFSHTQNNHLMV